MAITNALVTGKLVIPGTTTGIRAKITATPMTENGALKWPADNTVSWGGVTVETGNDGLIPGSGLAIPLDSELGDEVLWRLVARPIDRKDLKAWPLGTFAITASTDLADLVPIETVAYTAAQAATFAELVADAEAAAAAVAAVTATNDGIMAAVAADPESEFAAVQAATYANAHVPANILGDHTGGYDRRLNVYNLKPSHMRRTRAKLGAVRAGTADLRMAVVAHSMGAGVGGTIGVNGWPERLVDYLNTAGFHKPGSGAVPCNRGASALDSRWSFGAGWALFGGSTSLFANSTNTNPAVFTSTNAGTVVEIWFGVTGTSGNYNVVIDGGAPVVVTPTGTNAPYLYSVTGLANTTHTVSIARNTGGAGYVFSAEVRDTTKGVRLYNGGIGGQKASAISDTSWYATPKFAAATNGWNADLIFVGPIITNDSFAGPPTVVATWKTQVQTGITSAKANGADVVLVVDTPVASLDSSAYMRANYELADENDLPLLDMYDRWGSYTTANAYGLMSDGTHPNATGYAEWAQAVLKVLGV